MDAVLQKIRKADDQELLQIISLVNQRYRQQFPDWETVFLSAPVGTHRRQQFYEALYELLLRFC